MDLSGKTKPWLHAYLACDFSSMIIFGSMDNYQTVVLQRLFVLLVIVLTGTCNAVNLTDGIDGLAAGLAVQSGSIFWFAFEIQ